MPPRHDSLSQDKNPSLKGKEDSKEKEFPKGKEHERRPYSSAFADTA
jgi:hypothetical protein